MKTRTWSGPISARARPARTSCSRTQQDERQPRLPAVGVGIRALTLGDRVGGAFCQEEQFGPVGVVLPYKDVDDALRIANDSRFGLNANVFGPTGEAIEVARRIRAGTVTINGGGRIRADAPWGGFGQSGVGREQGDEGFREFFEPKHIQWLLR